MIRLPDIDGSANKGVPDGVLDRAADETSLPLALGADRVAVGELAGIICMKGAENGTLCCVGRFWVVDVLDQGREAERVRQEDKFLHSPPPVNPKLSVNYLGELGGNCHTCRVSLQI